MSFSDVSDDTFNKEIFPYLSNLRYVSSVNKRLNSLYQNYIKELVQTQQIKLNKPNRLSWHMFYRFWLDCREIKIYQGDDAIATTHIIDQSARYAIDEAIRLIQQDVYNLVLINRDCLPVMIVKMPGCNIERLKQDNAKIEKIVIIYESLGSQEGGDAQAIRRYSSKIFYFIKKKLMISKFPIYLKTCPKTFQQWLISPNRPELLITKWALKDDASFRAYIAMNGLDSLREILSNTDFQIVSDYLAGIYTFLGHYRRIGPNDDRFPVIQRIFLKLPSVYLQQFISYDETIYPKLIPITQTLDLTASTDFPTLIDQIKTKLTDIGHLI